LDYDKKIDFEYWAQIAKCVSFYLTPLIFAKKYTLRIVDQLLRMS